jgi:hypothetical protein
MGSQARPLAALAARQTEPEPKAGRPCRQHRSRLAAVAVLGRTSEHSLGRIARSQEHLSGPLGDTCMADIHTHTHTHTHTYTHIHLFVEHRSFEEFVV